MPTYLYQCPAHGTFEQFGHLNDDVAYCVCGEAARRRPFSGVPYLKGETVPTHQIPNDQERWHKAEKEHRESGWDLDRAVRQVRKGIKEDAQGRKYFDAAQAGSA